MRVLKLGPMAPCAFLAIDGPNYKTDRRRKPLPCTALIGRGPARGGNAGVLSAGVLECWNGSGLLAFEEVRFANGLTLLGGSPYASFRENRLAEACAA